MNNEGRTGAARNMVNPVSGISDAVPTTPDILKKSLLVPFITLNARHKIRDGKPGSPNI
jgi:hypothetical protein